MVEWFMPDRSASWRCDIFLALSRMRSHWLNGEPFGMLKVTFPVSPPCLRRQARDTRVPTMP